MAVDLCVVGAGMIGSSAARHAIQLGQSVCLIGPAEPKERQGQEIFGAHYDEGRIALSSEGDINLAILASRSIARYRQIEAETGINFYHEVGCLAVCDESSELIKRASDSLKQQGLQADVLTGTEAEARFPYLSIGNAQTQAIFEQRNAGYINPRLLVEAQQKLAQNGGCRIIREIVKSVVAVDPVLWKITTDGGAEVLAKKVLVATGAFTDFRSILPRDLQLRLQPVTQAVVFAELSTEDQQTMRSMPSIGFRCVYQKQPRRWPKTDTEDSVDDYDCYVLPPIKYPDGKVYLKLGHGKSHRFEKPLKSPEEIANWYINGVPKDWEDDIKEIFKARFPDIKPVSFHFDACATVDTPSGRQYIDLVGTNLGVALGGNGCSAMSSDEIGRLAASLIVNGRWEDGLLSREAFKMILK